MAAGGLSSCTRRGRVEEFEGREFSVTKEDRSSAVYRIATQTEEEFSFRNLAIFDSARRDVIILFDRSMGNIDWKLREISIEGASIPEIAQEVLDLVNRLFESSDTAKVAQVYKKYELFSPRRAILCLGEDRSFPCIPLEMYLSQKVGTDRTKMGVIAYILGRLISRGVLNGTAQYVVNSELEESCSTCRVVYSENSTHILFSPKDKRIRSISTRFERADLSSKMDEVEQRILRNVFEKMDIAPLLRGGLDCSIILKKRSEYEKFFNEWGDSIRLIVRDSHEFEAELKELEKILDEDTLRLGSDLDECLEILGGIARAPNQRMFKRVVVTYITLHLGNSTLLSNIVSLDQKTRRRLIKFLEGIDPEKIEAYYEILEKLHSFFGRNVALYAIETGNLERILKRIRLDEYEDQIRVLRSLFSEYMPRLSSSSSHSVRSFTLDAFHRFIERILSTLPESFIDEEAPLKALAEEATSERFKPSEMTPIVEIIFGRLVEYLDPWNRLSLDHYKGIHRVFLMDPGAGSRSVKLLEQIDAIEATEEKENAILLLKLLIEFFSFGKTDAFLVICAIGKRHKLIQKAEEILLTRRIAQDRSSYGKYIGLLKRFDTIFEKQVVVQLMEVGIFEEIIGKFRSSDDRVFFEGVDRVLEMYEASLGLIKSRMSPGSRRTVRLDLVEERFAELCEEISKISL